MVSIFHFDPKFTCLVQIKGPPNLEALGGRLTRLCSGPPLAYYILLRRCFLFRFVEPLVYGAYPRSMRQLVKDRLPTFTEKETMMVNRSFDFIGINYYTSRYGKNEPASSGKPISYSNDQLASSWTRSKL